MIAKMDFWPLLVAKDSTHSWANPITCANIGLNYTCNDTPCVPVCAQHGTRCIQFKLWCNPNIGVALQQHLRPL